MNPTTVLSSERLSRRKFLKILGGLALAAGVSGVLWEVFRPKEEVHPARMVKPNVYTRGGKSLVSIVKGDPQSDIEGLVRRAVDAIGGIEKIVSSGDSVVVKPAVVTSDPNCAPDPRVVATVAKLAREAGGDVVIAECSGSGNTSYNLSKVGISSEAGKLGINVIDLTSEQDLLMEVPEGKELHEVRTFPTVYDCDVLISVPRLKRHSGATVTISLKNMMGTITKGEMLRFHRTSLSQCIADLNTVMKPDLTVIDAVRVMARTGPTGGDMLEMNTIFAAGDPVTADRISANSLQELEEQMGIPSFDASNVAHIKLAAQLGVGTDSLDEIEKVEINL